MNFLILHWDKLEKKAKPEAEAIVCRILARLGYDYIVKVYLEIFEQQKLAEEKQFRQLIMAMGGVKIDDAYEYLPVWCRRKNGRPLDEPNRK